MKLNKVWVRDAYKAIPFIERVEAWLGRVIGKEKYQIFHNCNNNYQWEYYFGFHDYETAKLAAEMLLPLLKNYPSGEIRIYDREDGGWGETSYDYADYLRKYKDVNQ